MFPTVSPRIVPTIVAVLFLAIVGYNTIIPGDDPYRCRALLERGRWIDPPDEEGSRAPFKHWQPDGCMLHDYSAADAQQCMEGRDIVFIGDSTSRAVAFGLGRLMGGDQAMTDQGLVPKHTNANFTYHGVRIQNTYNVWLNTSGDDYRLASSVVHLSTFGHEKKNPPPIKEQKGPALVYIAVGPWFSNTIRTQYYTPEARIAAFQEAVFNASDIVGDSGYDFLTDPMDPVDGVGNQIFFTPPSGPVYTGQVPKNIEESHQRARETKDFQNFLHNSTDELNFSLVWAMPELVYGQDKVWRDSLQSGIHVIDQVAEVRANILLNLRCNAKLDRLQRYPYNRTCCTDYGSKPLVQLGVVAFGLAWLVVCVFNEILDLMAKRNEPRWTLLSMEAGCFILAPLMCYYADRTQLMAKESAMWTFHDFAILCIPCIAIALLTIRKSLPPGKGGLFVQQDQPFLSRDQTDEWKGWMQCIILIYHWVNSSSSSLNILIRVLIAAYLFQTGYGNTQFFLKKKDFSFNCVASVLLRLNLLACSLAFFMNTDYMLYYLSPLVTFWFLVVYATMAIGHERYNDHVWLLLAKIFISALLVSGIALATPVTEWIFNLLRTVFYIQWSLLEWQSRLSWDLFIVYIGMLLALANFKLQGQGTVGLNHRIVLAIVGFMASTAYFYADWKDYQKWHPYTSLFPILGFIAMRNITTLTRNYHSKAMAWLGRCSLETFTLQFHLLLAADSRGVLLIGGLNSGGDVLGRWKSLIVIVPVFLWISSAAAKGTGHLIQAILHTSPATEKLNRHPGVRFMSQISTQNLSFFISYPQFRVAMLLITLWLLNLLSPGMTEAAADDSSTLHEFEYESYRSVVWPHQ
ncbi:CAS1 domain-containing protein [Ilyonectria robusta]|uniref:CAS1 domain-containing protein n=1 Tax=Ilyonectria robusta TaxID=1079257 RepID=UPI001E8E6B26|nr:CAS1 domain-containing protein [Ilyonectria robusta]KAH8721663.1 CAS1 domain-containing protein [Ilyonectria robusta]